MEYLNDTFFGYNHGIVSQITSSILAHKVSYSEFLQAKNGVSMWLKTLGVYITAHGLLCSISVASCD